MHVACQLVGEGGLVSRHVSGMFNPLFSSL